MFEKMMHGKKYLLIISNSDRSDAGGTQWWSILNISPKKSTIWLVWDEWHEKIHGTGQQKNSWEGLEKAVACR